MGAACSIHRRRGGDTRAPESSNKNQPKKRRDRCQAASSRKAGLWTKLWVVRGYKEMAPSPSVKASSLVSRALEAEALVPWLWAQK